MDTKYLEKLCRDSQEIVKQVGGFIRDQRGKVAQTEIKDKSLNSLVSYVDKTAEEMLVKRLGLLLPDSTFLTEEETVEQKHGKYRWIIDPLDGTTNFLHQLPCFSISVALQIDDKIEMGIVYEVNNEECFYAWKGGGAYLNNHSIKVTQTSEIKDTLIATGFPYRDFGREKQYFTAFKYFMKNTRGIRRMGSAAVDMAYVACGRFDAFFEYGLNAWDIAAGTIIVQEAGGCVYDFKGGNRFLFGGEIVAVNNILAKEVSQIVNQAFYETI